jgi:hypothetical protein
MNIVECAANPIAHGFVISAKEIVAVGADLTEAVHTCVALVEKRFKLN